MSQLAALQKSFLSEIFSQPNNILSNLASHPELQKAQQFELYQNSIFSRFEKALATIFPVCCELVGKEYFAHLVSVFIKKFPSHEKDLNNYGVEFADFIRTYPTCSTLPYLSDTAKLEWTWHQLYTAPLAQDFDYDKLAKRYQEDYQSIVFLLPEYSTLLHTPYPIQQIWEMHQANLSPTEILLKPNENYFLFILRDKDSIKIEKIPAVEFYILTWIKEKLTLETLCEKIEVIYPEICFSDLLVTWIAKSWIVDFI